MVLYSGRIVEHGEKKSVLNNPIHPYTQGLIDSIPRISGERLKRLKTIKGFSPERIQTDIKSENCIFSDRCKHAREICFIKKPDAVLIDPPGLHYAKCFLADEFNRC